jgi:hypothetical protein
VAHALEALMDGWLTDAEVAGGIRLGVAGVEVAAELVVRNSWNGHELNLSEGELT